VDLNVGCLQANFDSSLAIIESESQLSVFSGLQVFSFVAFPRDMKDYCSIIIIF
jgi:hypothetical protein